MNLKFRLILIFLLVGIVPIMVVGLLSYNIASQNVEEEEYKAKGMYVELTEQQLQDCFNEWASDSRVFANTREVYEGLALLRRVGGDTAASEWRAWEENLDQFIPLAVQEYGFGFIYLTDPDGICVYDSNDEIEGADLSDRDYVQGSLGGRTTWSELFFSNVINRNALVVSSPVYSGGLSGELVGTVNILFTGDFITGVVHMGLRELGTSADAYLINADGLLLTDTMLGEYASGAALNVSISTRVVEILSGPIRNGNLDFFHQEEYLNYMGNRVLGSLEVMTLGDTPVGLVVEVESAETFAAVNAMRNYMLLIGAVALIAVVFTGFFVATAISRPVREMAQVAGQIAKGDFTVESKVNRKDEIGQLARAFNTMSESLRALISQAVEMSTGVNSGSEAVSAASEEMSSSLEEVSASTNEFAGNAQQLSASSQTMAETNARILSRAEEGNKAIEAAVMQMRVINSRVSELQHVITEVDQRSRDIGQILSVITDIANQTNLLALNAAIEAARAGEQGRGFAVVAEEVRKLAEQSARAAKEIGQLIKATQEESSKALESMTLGVKDVETGTEVVSKTGATFAEILSDVSVIAKQVEETASAAEELSSGSEEMAASVEEQSSTMEEVAATAEELRASAERLFQELQKFKYQ
ncbi:MAG: methyl-accepting chemotaxis protein [Bacillota bacterium]